TRIRVWFGLGVEIGRSIDGAFRDMLIVHHPGRLALDVADHARSHVADRHPALALQVLPLGIVYRWPGGGGISDGGRLSGPVSRLDDRFLPGRNHNSRLLPSLIRRWLIRILTLLFGG